MFLNNPQKAWFDAQKYCNPNWEPTKEDWKKIRQAVTGPIGGAVKRGFSKGCKKIF